MLLAFCVGCGPHAGREAAGTAADSPESGEEGYVAPPELASTAKLARGGVQLTGRASPDARVRLATPGGAAIYADADGAGVWRINLPATAAPRLLGLSMSDHGRVVQAQGYLFLAPGGPAARLRAGGGTEVPGPAATQPTATALDYDNVLAATVSGRAPPRTTVSLTIDGVLRGEGVADAEGRLVAPLNQPLTAGTHDFALSAAGGESHLSAEISPPEPLAGAPFRAVHAAAGWRVDWMTPGGGEQSTLIVDPVGAAR
jgi:hypothetical protein